MNKDEEIISNISYCNNDFRTIYPQLLDTAKKLTNKWDPSLSNESDPGNILIKEAAIVGDKVNYHIDKNVLECFPLSATQQSSARQIYDLVGYNMHWYKSAECTVNFTLLKEPSTINENLTYIQVPTGTVISDTTGEYVYTLLEPSPIMTKLNTIYPALAIEGIINPYEINGDSLVTINSLDKNLRIYFPQNIVAENGIYVYNKLAEGQSVPTSFSNNILDNESNQWMLVDNLAKYPAGSKVFKFGLDLNSDNCYVQFPEDINTLIGDGLNVFYTTTMGSDGNIKNGVLNRFLTNFDVPLTNNETVTVNDNIVISNSASIGGADPETLQQAYRNYKRLIGTYDTLVTRRDYENAIYNLPNENNTNNLVSNVLVTDRTTDMNYSQKVIETNLDTNYAKNYVKQNTNNEDIMKSYDISLYLLKAPSSMLSVDDYNESFEPELDGTTKLLLENDIEELKSIQHNIYYIPQIAENNNENDDELYFNIRNICRLTGTLTTYYKVSSQEATEIENNIVKKLITTYNARQIDFGNALDYDDLISTIKSADDRIRNISINTPTYDPTLVYANGTTRSLYNDDNTQINNLTLAKMILAGKVQLFSFDNDFYYDFGQSNGVLFTNIESIHTENPIEINVVADEESIADSDYVTLDENDIIQIVTPNLITTDTFGATVAFAANFPIADGEIKKLTGGDKIKFIYYDIKTGSSTTKSFSNIIIQANGVTYPQSSANEWVGRDTNDWNSTNGTLSGTQYLTAGQSIDLLSTSNITLNAGTPYYVITNNIENGEYKLTLTDEDTILEENEFLLYTNSTLDGLVILGSGTTLRLQGNGEYTLHSKVISLDEVMSTSISDATSIWGRLPANIIAQENQITNLTQGDKVVAIGSATSHITCQNTLVYNQLITQFNYILSSGDTGKVTSIDNNKIRYKSNMILSGNAIVPQILKGTQKITINGKPPISTTTNPETALLYSYPINITGGDSVNVQVLNESTGKYESLLSVYKYEEISTTDSLVSNITRGDGGLLTITAKDIISELNYTFNQTGTQDFESDWYLIPCSFIIPNNAKILLSLPEVTAKIDTFLNVYNQTADNIYETTNTQNQILTIKDDSSNNSNLGISLGYIYDTTTNPGKLTIKGVEFTITGSLNTNGSTLTYIDTETSTSYIYTYDTSTETYKRQVNSESRGYIKLDTTNTLMQFYDKDILQDLVSDMTSLSVTFGYIQRINGLNSDEIDSENIAGAYYKYDITKQVSDVISKMSSILNNINANFDWTYNVPASSKVLQPISGESYFNTNHIYNLCTVSKIDFENSSIKVNPSSIK